jgi:SAM-dependent methyltransferase
VLELGPGVNLAGTLGLRALGAGEAIAADKWLAPWDNEYSPAFCRAMAERIRREEPGWNAGVFEQAGISGYDGVVSLIHSGAETLPEVIDGKVDVILSNAVLEHVADHAAMARALFAVTRPGGVGLHQVDFRDHVDFSRPFEHLLEGPDTFLRAAEATFFERGCQMRPAELGRLFESAGFQTECYPGSPADEAYFNDFLARLRSSSSLYRAAAEEMLRPLDAYYVLRRL